MVKAVQMVLNGTSRRPGKGCVVKFTVTGPVEEALPLIAVEYEYPLIRITGHAHQDPLRAVYRCERDLYRAVAGSRALPGLRGQVNAQRLDRRLGGHGFLATPQYSQRCPSLSARSLSSAPHKPVKAMAGAAPPYGGTS